MFRKFFITLLGVSIAQLGTSTLGTNLGTNPGQLHAQTSQHQESSSETEQQLRWIEQLEHPSAGYRLLAAKRIAQAGYPSANVTQALIQCLKDPNSDVRLYSSFALSRTNYELPQVLMSLSALLEDQDEHVRYSAEWTLAQLCNRLEENQLPSNINQLHESLSRSYEKLRISDAQPLHMQAVEQVVVRLAKLKQPDVQQQIADVKPAPDLNHQIEQLRLRLANADRLNRYLIVDELAATESNPTIIKALMQQVLKAGDERLVTFCLERLRQRGQLAMQELFDELPEPLQAWSVTLLNHLQITTGQAYGSRLGRLLQLAANSKNLDEIRIAAMKAMATSGSKTDSAGSAQPTGHEQIQSVLVKLVTDHQADEELRMQAARTLKTFGQVSQKSLQLLIACTENCSDNLRAELVTCLPELAPNSNEAANLVAGWLAKTDPSSGDFFTLARSLGRFKSLGAAGLQSLVLGLNSSDESIQLACVEALTQMGPSAAPAEETLVGLILDPTISIRVKSAVARALQNGQQETIAKLCQALSLQNPVVREHVLQVIAALGPTSQQATSACLALLKDTQQPDRIRALAAMALGEMGSASHGSIPTLLSYTNSQEIAELRAACLIAATRIDATSRRPERLGVEQYLNDPQARVRIASAFSLHLIGQTSPSVLRLVSYLGDSSTDKVVEAALLEIGPVAVPYLLEKARQPTNHEKSRLACIQIASAISAKGQADWQGTLNLLSDPSLASAVNQTILRNWDFDHQLTHDIASALRTTKNPTAEAQLRQLLEYVTSELGANESKSDWASSVTRELVADLNLAPKPVKPEPQVAEMAPDPVATPLVVPPSKVLPAMTGNDRLVKVYYGTNRKSYAVSDGSTTSRKMSIGLAVAALATCAFGFIRKKSAAYSIAAITGIGAVSTLVVNEVGTKSNQAQLVKYSGSFNDRVELGICEVSIPESHKPGEIERPNLLFQLDVKEDVTKHIVVQGIHRLPNDAFYGDLKSTLKTKGKNVLVFVHGYNVSFDDAARRTAQMAYDLEFQGAPVFYSWPSQANWYNYADDQQNIQQSVKHIKQFLVNLAEKSNADSISLVAHSMGSVGLTSALVEMQDNRKFDQIVLAAPDIDANIFKNEIAPRIVTKANRVTLYTSKVDLALIASKYFNRAIRAGDSTQKPVLYPGIETIDATAVDSSLIGHSYYGSELNVLYDLGQLLSGQPTNARPYLKQVTDGELPYWRFEKSRTALENSPLLR